MDDDGGATAKSAKIPLPAVTGAAATVPGGRRDRLSDLPDHLLLRILLRLPTDEAAQTSVLSRRWRGVWFQLPALTFKGLQPSVPARALAAFAAHEASDIHSLTVSSEQVAAQESTAWLLFAASVLSGSLHFDNRYGVSLRALNEELMLHGEVVVGRGAIELPCFKKATEIWFDLGFLGLALPPAGVFDALRVLCLENFRFQGQFSISDTMCPSLQELTISRTRGLVGLALNSKSLVYIDLFWLLGFQRLNIVAPGLKLLKVTSCFYDAPRPIASIAAERLEVLRWEVPYDPESVCLGEMPRLCRLGAPPISASWSQGSQLAQICARFLKRFPAVDHLELDINLVVSAYSSSWT